jgi:hypothetical protein
MVVGAGVVLFTIIVIYLKRNFPSRGKNDTGSDSRKACT